MIITKTLDKLNELTLVGRFYSDLIKYTISNILKSKLPKVLKSKNINISLYTDKIKFNFVNLNKIYNLDYFENYTRKIQLTIPLILKDCLKNKTDFLKYCICELPFLNNKGNIYLNSINRILLTKLEKTLGIYKVLYTKEDFVINELHIFITSYVTSIIISLNKKFPKISLKFKGFEITIDYFYILYFLGISIKNIFSNSRYKDSLILNTMISKSIYKTFKKKLVSGFFKFGVIAFLEFYKSAIYKRPLLKELISILDFILDLSFNKQSPLDNEHFGFKKVLNIDLNLRGFLENYISNICNSLKIFKVPFKKGVPFFLSQEVLLSNPLLRIVEDFNVISEISNNYKLINSSLNNSTIQTSSLNQRDFRINQICKFCILDTADGPSSGLIISLTLNSFLGFKNEIYNPLFRNNPYKLKNFPIIKSIPEMEHLEILLEKWPVKKGFNFNKYIVSSITEGSFKISKIVSNNTNYISLNLYDLLGPSESLIPFLNYNESTRSLMAAKMQVQALPLLKNNYYLILTGNEFSNINYQYNTRALQEGIVLYVSSFKIIIRDLFNREITYYLYKYKNSNSNVIKYEKPLVWVGERINTGQILTVNESCKNTEFTTGITALVIFGSYFGFDYEDSIIVSQQFIYNNIFSTLHLDIYEEDLNYNIESFEYNALIALVTNNFEKFIHLNKFGIIKEGVFVYEGIVLISKIKRENIILNSIDLNLAFIMFGNLLLNIQDVSLAVKKASFGKILKTELYIKYKQVSNEEYLTLRIYIGSLKNINIGDKLCGRHGNKGIISYISKPSDFPFLSTGQIPDIITGALGIPSRMNLGQLYEGLYGLNSFYLDKRFNIQTELSTIGINYIKSLLYYLLIKTSFKTSFYKLFNPYDPGKLILRDGRSGRLLKGNLCLGVLQYFKLVHMVKDKINYRTIGKYKELIQQPIRGRDEGGQRFGEMELWSLEAFGSSYTIKELLSFRSDDILGRVNLNEMILNFKDTLYSSNISETFKVVLKELQSLSLNTKIFINYPTIAENLKDINIYKIINNESS